MKSNNNRLSDVGVSNGAYFGLPDDAVSSQVVVIPVPWDVTTSYRDGTSKGPEAIREASVQLDFYDTFINNAWEKLPRTFPFPHQIAALNKQMRPLAKEIIQHLEEGGSENNPTIREKIKKVNHASEELNHWLEQKSTELLAAGKIPVVLGGDHSSPLGLMRALGLKHAEFGILQFDAHADLRIAYEGFEFSHASIMHNALKINAVKKLVQCGIRDLSADEAERAEKDDRIELFHDQQIAEKLFEGENWSQICGHIINRLPQKVYISFDIDALDPALCPDTGTPVPGGMSFNQALYLLRKLHASGKEIIAFDLCETAPGDSEINVITAARLLYQLSILTSDAQNGALEKRP